MIDNRLASLWRLQHKMKKKSYMLEDRKKGGWGREGGQTPSNIQESASYDSQQNVHISCVLFNAITAGRVTESFGLFAVPKLGALWSE
jgi:hypothetical protein